MRDRGRILGAVYGHLVGDALGVPYEFTSRQELPREITWRGSGAWNQPPGTYSDDGALMLCSLASLAEHGGFDATDMGERFVRWFRKGYMAAGGVVFDIGSTTRRALAALESGTPALQAGPTSPNSGGNGSLMRILPVSLWAHRRPTNELVDVASDASCITHGSIHARLCCALYSLLVRRIADGTDRAGIWDACTAELGAVFVDRDHSSESSEMASANSADAPTLLDALRHIREYRRCDGSGYVVDCLWSAWAAFRDATNYVDAVCRAVRFGNDTDTTAAVAGGLAGLHFGFGDLPAQWVSDLRLSAEQRALIDCFAVRVAGEPSS